MTTAATTKAYELLGAEAEALLSYEAKGFNKKDLHLPGPDFVDRVVSQTDRSPSVLRNFQTILNAGRLSGTGYVSILPVDQGIEHSAGASFAPAPIYFDPANIVKLAIEGGCNCVVSTLGTLGAVSRRYAHKIPFMVKLNHNEFLTYPNKFDQIMFASVEQAFEMGAVAVGATVYFGSDESTRQIQEVSEAFARAHELGMVTVLWCYTRNPAFKTSDKDYHVSADLTGQANHLGVTIEGLLGPRPGRSPDRDDALPAGQLLHGPHAADQLGRRVGQERLRRRRPHGRHQQARRRHGPDQRPQGVPAADVRGRQAAADDPGRLPRFVDHVGISLRT